MQLSADQVLSDRDKMIAYICRRVPQPECRVVLARGQGGTAWADLMPLWDDELGWDLRFETNSTERVTLRQIYDHFREQDMTTWERGHVFAPSAEPVRCSAPTVATPTTASTERDVHCSENVLAEVGKMRSMLEALLATVEKQRRIKDWYSTAEIAEELHKAEFTVREWCRLGQCKAQKSKGYRGGKKQWMISHEEKLRLENEGPAPHGTYRRPSTKY